MAKQYEIPLVELMDDYEIHTCIVIGSDSPVWESLHKIWEEAKNYNELDEERKYWRLGDKNRAWADAEDDAIVQLVGLGFAPRYGLD